MAESGAIRAGRAYVELFTDNSQLVRGLAQTQRKFQAWGKTMTSIGMKAVAAGAALAAPLLAATKIYASMGAELARGAAKTGISVESLSELKYAAEQSGSSLEALEKGAMKMSKALVSAAGGSPKAVAAFSQLGLSVRDLLKLKPDQQFKAIAGAISRIQNANLRSSLAQQIFGKGGVELLPLLAQGASGIEAMQQHARELGLTMSGEDAKGALQFTQTMNDLWSVIKMGAFQIGAALAPAREALMKTLTGGIVAVREFLKEHKGLITGLSMLATGLIAGGFALATFGKIFGIMGSIIGGAGTAITAVSAAIAFILSPIGIAMAAVVGLGAAFLYLTDAGKATRGYLADVWDAVKADSTEAFGGIKDALASGDWGLAAQIAWTFIKLETAKGTAAVKQLWLSFEADAMDLWADLTTGVRKVWSYMLEYLTSWDGVKTAITKFINWMADAFENVVDKVSDLIQDLFMTTGKKQLKIELAKIDDLESSGKISHDFAEKQRKAAQDTFGDYDDKARRDRDAQRNAEYARRQAKADADFKAKHPELAAREEENRAKIESERLAQRKRIEDQIAAEKAKGNEADQSKINGLKDQLKAQTEQAHVEARNLPDFKGPKFNPDDAQEGIAQAMKSVGTFSGAALFGLGGGGDTKRIADNTRQTNVLLTQLITAQGDASLSGWLAVS